MRIDLETLFTSDGACSLSGEKVRFHVVTDKIIFYDNAGEAEATAHTIAYLRTDKTEKSRPVLFAYNGGPGSSSSTIHIGALAPWRVKIEGNCASSFVPPFEMEENPDTVLDICDIVLIDPVGCGYSRLLKEDAADKYYSSEGDAVEIVQIISKWITVHNRWNSPLYIMGESYGTIRNALVAEKLFYNENPGLCSCNLLHLSGIIMLGTALDHGQTPFPVDSAVLNFTSIAATYWLHHQEGRGALKDFIEEASEFAYREYLPALALGRRISEEEKEHVIEKLQYFTGLDKQMLEETQLRVETAVYPLIGMKKEGFRVSRYDGRFKMDAMQDISDYDMFGDDAISAMIMPALNHCFNAELKAKLGIETDELYDMMCLAASERWNFKTSKPPVKSLENAMRKNPQLKLMFATGYYDMVTTLGYTEYLANKFDLPEHRVKFEAYESGHMPYLGTEPAAKFGRDLHDFIKWTVK